jgi:Domain of unknown function (DUF5753)
VPEWFQVYLGLEAEAASIHEYAAELVLSLLQTADYYRAFMRTAPAAGDDEAIERKIAVRSARQERLTTDDAPECWAVLNEAAVRRVVGGMNVMRAQLQHIGALADRPHINVQVLPFRTGGHPAMDGSFIILGFPEAQTPMRSTWRARRVASTWKSCPKSIVTRRCSTTWWPRPRPRGSPSASSPRWQPS